MVLEDNRLRPSAPSASLPESQPPTGRGLGNRRNRGRFTRRLGNGNYKPQPAGGKPDYKLCEHR
ncbi:hypothetical protein HAV15_006336 [Penicillium sp. str. |nr:hypothetical protein HAV15_006336 [Penicillium sp. str. \